MLKGGEEGDGGGGGNDGCGEIDGSSDSRGW